MLPHTACRRLIWLCTLVGISVCKCSCVWVHLCLGVEMCACLPIQAYFSTLSKAPREGFEHAASPWWGVSLYLYSKLILWMQERSSQPSGGLAEEGSYSWCTSPTNPQLVLHTPASACENWLFLSDLAGCDASLEGAVCCFALQWPKARDKQFLSLPLISHQASCKLTVI